MVEYCIKLNKEQVKSFILFCEQVGQHIGGLAVDIQGFLTMFEIKGQIEKQDKIKV